MLHLSKQDLGLIRRINKSGGIKRYALRFLGINELGVRYLKSLDKPNEQAAEMKKGVIKYYKLSYPDGMVEITLDKK